MSLYSPVAAAAEPAGRDRINQIIIFDLIQYNLQKYILMLPIM